MDIRSVERIGHPVDEVYTTFRDRLPEITRYIPNVDRIEVVEREELGTGRLRLLNHWYAIGEIPAVARSILKPEMLSWKDHARWDDDALHVEWELETHFFTEAVSCRGVNAFQAVGDDETEVALSGTLELDLAAIPMVPRLLRTKVSSEVERFVVALIQPNLANAVIGVRRFLDAQSEG